MFQLLHFDKHYADDGQGKMDMERNICERLGGQLIWFLGMVLLVLLVEKGAVEQNKTD